MNKNYYIVGDIHGCLEKLQKIMIYIYSNINPEIDEIIFIGDYIDRGPAIYETVRYLADLDSRYKVTFLEGNHEDMLKMYLRGGFDPQIYYMNGGMKTIESYKNVLGDFIIPENHRKVLFSGKYYYEGDDFIVVHAGIPPFELEMNDYYYNDLIWIRDDFFNSGVRYKKTVIFGHTVTDFLHKHRGKIYKDKKHNIIGIDTGAVYGGKLTCLRWPDLKIYQS
ncbi:MAG: serine/threonine protein phosphatase [Spirochaetes bacterium]|nr:serine/threonine protein phosphatase [Spirochaetota bacterium]